MKANREGQASVLIPTRGADGTLLRSVIITASGAERGTQREVTFADWTGERVEKGLTLKLDRKPVSCGETIAAEEFAALWSKTAMGLNEDVQAEFERQYAPVQPHVFKAYVKENGKAIASYTQSEIIPSGATRLALDGALGRTVARLEAAERRAAREQFIKDLAAAAQAYAEERDRKLAEARVKARAEAEARAAAIAAQEAEEERREISERCFGAIGPGCGIWEGRFPPSLCGPNNIQVSGENAGLNWGCAINSGSWKHDECCAADPNGHWCFGPGEANQNCSVAFNRGLARLVSPYTWERTDIDINKRNTTGDVVHDDYCAKNDTLMWKHEMDYCCSKTGGELSWWGVAVFITNHGAWAFNTPNTRYCKAP